MLTIKGGLGVKKDTKELQETITKAVQKELHDGIYGELEVLRGNLSSCGKKILSRFDKLESKIDERFERLEAKKKEQNKEIIDGIERMGTNL